MGARFLGAVFSAVLFAASIGCGGGGGSDGPQEGTLVLKPVAGLSGSVSSAGGVTILTGAPVGDDPVPTTYRIVQVFSLDAIPAGAEVLSAVYQNEQFEVVGDPYATLGIVRMNSADVGSTLGAGDYILPLFSLVHGTLSDNASLGLKTLDLTDYLRGVVNEGISERIDIMLRFTVDDDADGAFDQTTFYGPARDGDVPGIVVRYRR